MSDSFCRPHPRKNDFDEAARPQYSRFARGELKKDQLMLNLRHLEQRYGLVGWLDWTFWTGDGYTLPWDREEGTGEPGTTASQGGMR